MPGAMYPSGDAGYMQGFKPNEEGMMNHQEYMKMMGMNPFMYVMPVMKNMMPNCADFRYGMNNYAFYPMMPGARPPRHYPPYVVFGDHDTSTASMNSLSTQGRAKERVPKSRSDSPVRNFNNKLSLDGSHNLTTINEKSANSEESSNFE